VLTDGTEGTGYTYTGGKGGHAIAAMVHHDLAPFLIGQDASAVEDLYDGMQWHIHYVGRGGVASFAISAVDIALWDIRGKKRDWPLWKLAGGADNRCKAYCGGIDLNFPLPKLLRSIQGYLDRGFNGVKIKIGQPTIEADLSRKACVMREAPMPGQGTALFAFPGHVRFPGKGCCLRPRYGATGATAAPWR
jgi:L-alanine-DL-glutamate epimerase-like enolase superfamily enzyme